MCHSQTHLSGRHNYEHLNLPGSYLAKCNKIFIVQAHMISTLNYSTCIKLSTVVKFRQVSGSFM